METAGKLAGKPFAKGDPRINRGGRPKQLLTRAIAETLTLADAKKIVKRVISQATAGDLQAAAMLWDRLEGKAIARQESGEPGAFDLDLGADERAQLRAALKVTRGLKSA